MAVFKNGTEMFTGAVIDIWSHFYMDGMEEEYAEVWDIEKHKRKNVKIGYYGSDGRNLYEGHAEVDLNAETVKDMVDTYKAMAWTAFSDSVIAFKKEIRAGVTAEVVKGRKVKQGTILRVFWVGKKYNRFTREDEMMAGGFDENENKVWIKAEYLKNLTKVKSPNAKERKKFMKHYLKMKLGDRIFDAYVDNKMNKAAQ